MWPAPNIISVFGGAQVQNATEIVLRKVLKFKEFSGPVVIIDYTGRGALVLKTNNDMSISRRRVLWYDLADRRKPVALFQLSGSIHFRNVMLSVFRKMRQISRFQFSDRTIEWAIEAANSLSRYGSVGLGALFRILVNSETRKWFLETQKEPEDLSNLLCMIKWALQFSAVYAISEGANKSLLKNYLEKRAVIWIEAQPEHFEKDEHLLVSCMADAAIEDAILSLVNSDCVKHKDSKKIINVVYLFPPAKNSAAIPEWVKETARSVKHVSVHSFQPARPLSPLQLSWAREASDVWIAGGTHGIKISSHGNWLSENEINRINKLRAGDLWVRSNKSGKSLVVKVRCPEGLQNEAYKFRHSSAIKRKSEPVRQMATATTKFAGPMDAHYGLYRTLCRKDILNLGWQKMRHIRKNSHGTDGVTASAFKADLDNELDRLSMELSSKTYRCAPLRRFFIPKPGGGQRPISVACVRDRVVQSTCLLLLEPIFEQAFSQYSFAFRPRRSAHQAISVARSMIKSDQTWVVIADIYKCFDRIDHGVLIKFISHKVADVDLLDLIKHWLTCDVLEFNEVLPVLTGVPQGESISPLLANIYLDPLDKHFKKLGLDFVRFADDIIVFTTGKTNAEKALGIMRNFLIDPLLMELKASKTFFCPVKEGFDFLGFKFSIDNLEILQGRTERVCDVLRNELKTMGQHISSFKQRADAITKINAVIRGFRNYFALPDKDRIAAQLQSLDARLEQLANYYLPRKIKDDPAWIHREKFWPSATQFHHNSGLSKMIHANKIGIGYPEYPQNKPQMPWQADDMYTKQDVKIATDNPNEPNKEEKAHAPEKDEPAKGLFEEGKRLYVLLHGSYLAIENQDLIITKRKKEIYRRSLSELSLIFLQGFGINISVNLQLNLVKRDILVVFAPFVGNQIAVVNPLYSAKSSLRKRQAIRRDDPDIISVGLNMIACKVNNQAALIRYFSKYRKKSDFACYCKMTSSAYEISELADSIRSADPAGASVRAQAMGFEGHAAAIYWRQIKALIPNGLKFPGRVTKAARDIVNQCLNYGYGILYGEVWRAVAKAGLDPYFGIMHGSQRDKGSLVFDLIEEFRAPFVDRMVVGMMGRGFTPEVGTHGELKSRTRRKLTKNFLKRWTKKMSWRSQSISPSDILSKQADNLASLFNGEGSYKPFKMKW